MRQGGCSFSDSVTEGRRSHGYEPFAIGNRNTAAAEAYPSLALEALQVAGNDFASRAKLDREFLVGNLLDATVTQIQQYCGKASVDRGKRDLLDLSNNVREPAREAVEDKLPEGLRVFERLLESGHRDRDRLDVCLGNRLCRVMLIAQQARSCEDAGAPRPDTVQCNFTAARRSELDPDFAIKQKQERLARIARVKHETALLELHRLSALHQAIDDVTGCTDELGHQ